MSPSLFQKATGELTDANEPDWDIFKERFRQYMISHPMQVADISGRELQLVLSRMLDGQASGSDHWRVSELKLLPLCLLDALADLLN
eukprot:6905860-Karenia_brevis.AAC.1